MYFRSAILCEKLKLFEKIIIYGAGNFAQEIYPKLVQYGLKEKIMCFTQTDDNGPASLDGIPVINIKVLSCDKVKCVVLIAVSRLYVDAVKETLLEYDYPNIVSLVDYFVHYRRFEEDYRYLTTFEEYCEYIADWYMRTQKGNQDDSMVIQKILDKETCSDRKIDANLVIMICGHLSSRTIKIAGALKRKNYNIVLLHYFDGANPWNLDELEKLDIPMRQCGCIVEMLFCALQYHPLVYFFEPRWGDCLWAEIMLKNKQYFGKIVLALYDVMNDGYTRIERDKLATEKYALEHADGIVWRWFSKEYLEEKGFRYQGKSIQFLDYCDHENVHSVSDNLDSSIVKLSFVCGYGDEYVASRACLTQYADWARIGEILEKIGNREDCIFHFYVGAFQNNENVRCCEQYEIQYENFNFFLGTEHNELLKRLMDYDYGSELWINGEIPPDEMPIGDYYGSSYKNSIRNAYFDFLSVGLPVITFQSSKMWEYLSADDVMIKMTLDDLDIDYLKEHKHYYKAKVAEKRKEWDIDNQITKLIQFFKEI